MTKATAFASAYAQLYDALYRDKDYPGECDYLEKILRRYADGAVRSLIDIGCGTGGHALVMVARGYTVTGIDLSEGMLEAARAKAAQESLAVCFERADIRDFSLGAKFDAAVSMFAVMSYQASNEDFAAALRSVRRHLTDGGLFVFDVWYGPAVLAEKPEEREKIIDLGRGERVVRKARPVLDLLAHTVEVNYELTRFSGDVEAGRSREAHKMRFFFPQELAYFLGTNGFEMLALFPFGAVGEPVSERDWNVTVVAKATATPKTVAW